MALWSQGAIHRRRISSGPLLRYCNEKHCTPAAPPHPPPPPPPVLLLLLLLAVPGRAFGFGWMSNDGTASESLVVGSSGTTPSGTPLLERQKGFMAVDGNITSQWNAAIDPADKSCWLVLDFGAEVTIHGVALIQRGDITHDAKDHELQTAAGKDGPWQSVGSFLGQECKPPAFSASQCREKNQPGAAAFRQTFDLPAPAASRYFRWVAKTRFSEYQLYLYEIQFRFSAWGAVLLLLLGFSSCIYIAGGVAHSVKTAGKPWRVPSHPHYALWVELCGLVLDGLAYTRAAIAGRSAASGGRHAVRAGRSKEHRHYGATQLHETRGMDDDRRISEDSRGVGKKSKGSKRSKGKDRSSSVNQFGHDEEGGSATAKSSPAEPISHGNGSKGPGRWIHIPSA